MKKAYFLADLHLGSACGDAKHEAERSAVRFLEYISEDACEIYLLGDILDYWFEYKYVVPRGYVRFLGKLAELADKGVKITWFIGNHDIWIFDYLPNELGITVVDGMLETYILGVPFCMQHGDAIGGSKKFRILRKLFRNKFCQKLYAGIHPRFTVGFAYDCSQRSRNKELSSSELPPNLLDGIKEWCENRIAERDGSKYFVFGHLHKASETPLPEGRKLIVLPPWINEQGYGVFDGKDFKFKNFQQ